MPMPNEYRKNLYIGVAQLNEGEYIFTGDAYSNASESIEDAIKELDKLVKQSHPGGTPRKVGVITCYDADLFDTANQSLPQYSHPAPGMYPSKGGYKGGYFSKYDSTVYHVIVKLSDEIKFNENITYSDARRIRSEQTHSFCPVGSPTVVRLIYLTKLGLDFKPSIPKELEGDLDFGSPEYYERRKIIDKQFSDWEKHLKKLGLVIKIKKIVENGKIVKGLDPEMQKYAEDYLSHNVKMNFSERLMKCFSFIYHVRLTDRNNKSKSVSIDNLEAGSWQEAVDKVITDHPEFGLKPGDYEGSSEVEVHWNYGENTLKSF